MKECSPTVKIRHKGWIYKWLLLRIPWCNRQGYHSKTTWIYKKEGLNKWILTREGTVLQLQTLIVSQRSIGFKFQTTSQVSVANSQRQSSRQVKVLSPERVQLQLARSRQDSSSNSCIKCISSPYCKTQCWSAQKAFQRTNCRIWINTQSIDCSKLIESYRELHRLFCQEDCRSSGDVLLFHPLYHFS